MHLSLSQCIYKHAIMRSARYCRWRLSINHPYMPHILSNTVYTRLYKPYVLYTILCKRRQRSGGVFFLNSLYLFRAIIPRDTRRTQHGTQFKHRARHLCNYTCFPPQLKCNNLERVVDVVVIRIKSKHSVYVYSLYRAMLRCL